MKKLIIFLISFLLILISLRVSAQHPFGEGSLLVGNGYFTPADKSGDGTWRYAEARWLPIKGAFSDTRFGVYLSGVEVGSKISDFTYHSTEIGIGLAVNFNLQSGYRNDRYVWLNAAYKFINSTGRLHKQDGLYENSQEDQMLFMSGGILLRSLMFTGPFAQQKVMIESQFSVTKEQNAYWNGDPLIGAPWNRERFKLQIENGIAPIYLNWSRSVYILPSVLAAYTYERGSETSFYTIGASLTLAKGEYGYDILTLSYEPKFWSKGERIDVFQINLNVVNIFRRNN